MAALEPSVKVENIMAPMDYGSKKEILSSKIYRTTQHNVSIAFKNYGKSQSGLTGQEIYR